jgi:pentatricopeptide repeat protein
MKSLNIEPNEITYNHIISAYARTGSVEKVEQLMEEVAYKGL